MQDVAINIPIGNKVAISLFTEHHLRVYSPLNRGFHRRERNAETLANELLYSKLLIQSLRLLGDLGGYHVGMVYRGVRRFGSEYISTLYDDLIAGRSSLRVGIPIKFLAFTSTSRDIAADERFGTDFFYSIDLIDNQGVSIAGLSAFGPSENEVLLIPPAVFTVTSVELVNHSIRVSLTGVASAFRYL